MPVWKVTVSTGSWRSRYAMPSMPGRRYRAVRGSSPSVRAAVSWSVPLFPTYTYTALQDIADDRTGPLKIAGREIRGNSPYPAMSWTIGTHEKTMIATAMKIFSRITFSSYSTGRSTPAYKLGGWAWFNCHLFRLSCTPVSLSSGPRRTAPGISAPGILSCLAMRWKCPAPGVRGPGGRSAGCIFPHGNDGTGFPDQLPLSGEPGDLPDHPPGKAGPGSDCPHRAYLVATVAPDTGTPRYFRCPA